MARLLVSIPPCLRGDRFATSSRDSLQHQLINSWTAAGFQVVSLNTVSELQAHPLHRVALEQAGLEVLEVPSSKPDFPDYLPNLAAALGLASNRYPGDVLAIANADIHISLDSDSSSLLHNLQPDQFLLAHRTDIQEQYVFGLPILERQRALQDQPFLPGIDFVAARAQAFRAALPFLGQELTIGLPWWDLLLPMALLSAGATKQHLNSLQFLHLSHSDRWDLRWQDRIGKSATQHLNASIKGFRAPVTAFIWSLAYQKLTSPLQHPRILYSRLRSNLHQLRRERRGPVYLHDVLRMTEGLVCEPGWPLDRRWVMAWQPEKPL